MNVELCKRLFGEYSSPLERELRDDVLVCGLYHHDDWMDLIKRLDLMNINYCIIYYDKELDKDVKVSNCKSIKNKSLDNIKVADEVLNPVRMNKLADLRNELVSDIPDKFNYVIIQDFDLLSEKEDYIKLTESITSKLIGNEYDGIFANGLLQKSGENKKIGNVVTFSAGSVVYNDASAYLDLDFDYLESDLYMKEGLHSVLGGMMYRQLTTKDKLIPVKSAFGGMGIYKVESIKGHKYSGTYNNRPICEHIPFNLGLKLAVNKEVILMYS